MCCGPTGRSSGCVSRTCCSEHVRIAPGTDRPRPCGYRPAVPVQCACHWQRNCSFRRRLPVPTAADLQTALPKRPRPCRHSAVLLRYWTCCNDAPERRISQAITCFSQAWAGAGFWTVDQAAGAEAIAEKDNCATTGTWSDGFSQARTCFSMSVETSRSAASGDNIRWSIRMPLFLGQAPA